MKRMFFIIFIALLSLNLAQSIWYHRRIVALSSQNDSIKEEVLRKKGLLLQTEENFLLSHQLEGEVFAPISLTSCIGKEKSDLKSLKNRYDVFLYVSVFHCWSCVETVAKMAEKCKPNKVAYIVEVDSHEVAEALIALIGDNKHIFYSSGTPVPKLGKILQPYFFRIDKEGRLHQLFIPIKEQSIITEKFLTNLKPL